MKEWAPITLEDMLALTRQELALCDETQRRFFAEVHIVPERWKLSPWGDLGNGFWAVAVYRDRVLWYNDIEHGFNVSRFRDLGRIPGNQYWCNQDGLGLALTSLRDGEGTRLSPPVLP